MMMIRRGNSCVEAYHFDVLHDVVDGLDALHLRGANWGRKFVKHIFSATLFPPFAPDIIFAFLSDRKQSPIKRMNENLG